ncbi:MAG: hypothetical protein ABH879_01865 [archaeon]
MSTDKCLDQVLPDPNEERLDKEISEFKIRNKAEPTLMDLCRCHIAAYYSDKDRDSWFNCRANKSPVGCMELATWAQKDGHW